MIGSCVKIGSSFRWGARECVRGRCARSRAVRANVQRCVRSVRASTHYISRQVGPPNQISVSFQLRVSVESSWVSVRSAVRLDQFGWASSINFRSCCFKRAYSVGTNFESDRVFPSTFQGKYSTNADIYQPWKYCGIWRKILVKFGHWKIYPC